VYGGEFCPKNDDPLRYIPGPQDSKLWESPPERSDLNRRRVGVRSKAHAIHEPVDRETPKDFTTIFSTKVGKENTGNTCSQW